MTDTLQRPALELVSAPLDHQIADYLAAFWPALPEKHIRMNANGPKYSWAKDNKNHSPLTYATLLAHAAGTLTAGAHLHTSAGLCRIGMLDIDQGGRAAVVAALAAAHKLGFSAYGLYYPAGQRAGAEHDGGRLVVPFADYADKRAIFAGMEQIRDLAGLPADTEIWPGGENAVALPLGVHLRKETRGQLLLQSGEVLDLDADLAGGFALVEQLQPNVQPPAAPVQPPHTAHKSDYAKPVIRSTPGERAAGRASLDDVKARFNAEHSIESVLDQWGKATATRDGWACNCGIGHTHDTTLYISKRGKLFSYSPRCHLYTTKGWDAFGLYVFLFHNNNVVEAAKALNPIQARPAAPQPATEYRTAAQDAEAERRRAERRAAAAATLVEIQARASQDKNLSDRAQLVLLALLETAGTRDWTRASVARVAELTELCERYVHEGLRELEDREYIASGQRNGSTTFRTFLRLQAYVKYADEYRYIACEGGASPASDENTHADTIESWHSADDGHSADELSALDQPPGEDPENFRFSPVVEIAPAQQEAPTVVFDLCDPDRYSVDCGRYDATGLIVWRLWDDTAKQVLGEYATEPDAFAAAWAKIEEIRSAIQQSTAPAAAFDDSAEPECATYTPVEIAPVAYTGITKHTQDTEARYSLVWASMRRRPEANDNDQAETANFADMPAPKPRKVSDKPRAIDRYLVELAGMTEKELGGEIIKHRRTINKNKGAHWLASVKEKLQLVEQEIAARKLHGTGLPRAPLTSSGPQARPAFQQQGAFL